MWKSEDRAASITPLVNSATMCSLSIQEECDNFLTDVGVLLRVKTAVAVGVVYITYVGLEERKQFDMSGPVIDDANAAEKWAEPGSVVLSQLAWDNCEQGLFIHELIEDGHHYKVTHSNLHCLFTAIRPSTHVPPYDHAQPCDHMPPYDHVHLLYDHVLLPYDHLLLPYDHLLLPYDHLLLPI